MKKVSGSTTTVYIFSGSKVIAEYDNGAAVTSPSREYIYAGSQLVAKIEAGATNYFHPDHLSTRANTDSSGNVSRTFGQYPFGEVWYETGTANKWKFTSYERDAESGNDYAMARSYINRYARFSSTDPLSGSIADPQSLNRYSYSRNDPVNLVDPSGALTCYWTIRLFRDESGNPLYYLGMLDFCADPDTDHHGGNGINAGGGGGGSLNDIINAALKQSKLAECLKKFFGANVTLTADNAPNIDASKTSQQLDGGLGQTDPALVPDAGKATVFVASQVVANEDPTSPTATPGTASRVYLHEVGNALAMQTFTKEPNKSNRAYLGPMGGPPTADQKNQAAIGRKNGGDPDIGRQFEDCIYGGSASGNNQKP